MNLDVHGGAYRCLLRLRENAGNPVMSDQEFSANYLSDNCVQIDPAMSSTQVIREMAVALGLAADIQISEEYQHILENYRAGRAVLVRLKSDSFSLHSYGESDFRVTVLSEMDEERLVVWCPMRNGSWEQLAPIDRSTWEATKAIGITLFEAKEEQGLLAEEFVNSR